MPSSHRSTNGRQADDGCQGYHGIVRNAPIGIYVSTPEGCLVSANPALNKMLGYDSPQKLIESISDIGKQI